MYFEAVLGLKGTVVLQQYTASRGRCSHWDLLGIRCVQHTAYISRIPRWKVLRARGKRVAASCLLLL